MTLAAITATLFAALASTGASASTVPVTTEPPEPELDMAGNELETTPVEPTVLTATYDLGLDRPRGQVLQRFIEEVEAASGGAITIDVTIENPDSIQQWSDGDFDITLTTARTLDTMGVTTFDVLSLPFLVQDDDQADRVATSDAADLMMAGLSAIDATGLVLAPVYQNHFAIAGDEPLRTLDQLHTGIRVYPLSNRVDQLFEAIGGHAAHDLDGDDWYNAIVSGEALAAELPTALADGLAEPHVDGHELHDLLRIRCRDDPQRLARRRSVPSRSTCCRRLEPPPCSVRSTSASARRTPSSRPARRAPR